MIPDPPSHLSPKPDARCTRPPKSRMGPVYYSWRIRMWIEGTFVLHMLEPWEKLLILLIFLVSLVLLMTGVVRYLPHHLSVMQRRSAYYLWGNENDEGWVLHWIGKAIGSSAVTAEL
ncbi:hypothetical protein E1B28_005935 [Marasmius oreades]|uniref:Uncharacterized protein n=1 Tax=Marasmius oreades TaxID=181124 RepID=A0A9P7S458_9AGAR|nr:uncharacterized protein E1B28_005935 [Marasmius oreades]KAG7095156.1 hypothetical protein E1B28_005935 [Marasmius oreades]